MRRWDLGFDNFFPFGIIRDQCQNCLYNCSKICCNPYMAIHHYIDNIMILPFPQVLWEETASNSTSSFYFRVLMSVLPSVNCERHIQSEIHIFTYKELFLSRLRFPKFGWNYFFHEFSFQNLEGKISSTNYTRSSIAIALETLDCEH